MKFILALFAAVALSLSAQAQQTNVYYSLAHTNSKSVNNCGTTSFRYDASSVFHPGGTNLDTNSWYYPLSNHMSISFTNPNVYVFANNQLGFQACGKGSVSWIDNQWTNFPDGYRFTLFWPTNVSIPPTNVLFPLEAVNLKTNIP